MAQSIQGGLIPPILSPMLPDDTVDEKSLHHLVEHILGGGATGIFVLGSTGEGRCLDVADSQQLLA